MKKKTAVAKAKTILKKNYKVAIGIAILVILVSIQSCTDKKIEEETFKSAYARGNELGRIAENNYAEAEAYFNTAKTSGTYAEVSELCEKAKDLYGDSEKQFITAQEAYVKAEEFAPSRTIRKMTNAVAQETALLANISSLRQETCDLLERTAYAAEIYRSDRTSRNLLGVKYYENATQERLKEWDVLIAEFNEVRLQVTAYKNTIS